MTVMVHVGAHKTATTHLQRSLRGAGPRLAARGVWLGVPPGIRRRELGLGSGLGGSRTAVANRRVAAGVIDAAAARFPHLVLSEENILGGLRRHLLFGRDHAIYPQAVARTERLMAMLGGRPATLLLSVREPASFLTSAFSMQVLGGFALEIEDYLGGFDPARLSWTDLARRLLGVGGVAGLVVWRYEDYRALMPALLDRMLPPGAGALVRSAAESNVGMSRAAYAELRRILPRPEPGDDDQGRRVRDLVNAVKARLPRAPGDPGPEVIPAGTAAAARAAYERDVADLAGLSGVEMLRP